MGVTTTRFVWRATVAGIVLQHERSLVLNRNPALLTLCGFSPLEYQDKPRIEIDNGKPDVSGTPQHGSREPQLLPVPEKPS